MRPPLRLVWPQRVSPQPRHRTRRVRPYPRENVSRSTSRGQQSLVKFRRTHQSSPARGSIVKNSNKISYSLFLAVTAYLFTTVEPRWLTEWWYYIPIVVGPALWFSAQTSRERRHQMSGAPSVSQLLSRIVNMLWMMMFAYLVILAAVRPVALWSWWSLLAAVFAGSIAFTLLTQNSTSSHKAGESSSHRTRDER